MNYANLHLHSIHSDAQFTAEQLVLIGKSLGYRALALTDHETDSGVKEFAAKANAEGIETIAGVEFYGNEDGARLHLTALDYDVDDPGIRSFIRERCLLQMEYTRKCVERGIQQGYMEGLTWNDVLDLSPDGAWLCIDSVMRVMEIKKMVSPDHDWKDFRINVFNAPEAKQFRPKLPSAQKVIEVVREAGGVIALAHPNHWTHYVEKLVSYGLNGIEISHPDLAEDQAYLALEAAKAFDLYHCGGTDHTGPMSGCGGKYAVYTDHGITEEEFFILKERRLG